MRRRRSAGTILLLAMMLIVVVLSAATVASLELTRWQAAARRRRDRTEAIWLARSAARAHVSASFPGGQVTFDGTTATAVVGTARVRSGP